MTRTYLFTLTALFVRAVFAHVCSEAIDRLVAHLVPTWHSAASIGLGILVGVGIVEVADVAVRWLHKDFKKRLGKAE